jgi:hypothetical protein
MASLLRPRLQRRSPEESETMPTQPFPDGMLASHVNGETCQEHDGSIRSAPGTYAGVPRHAAGYRLPGLSNAYRNVPAWANEFIF